MTRTSEGEELLAYELALARIPYEREFVFARPRRWRADFLVGDNILVEIDGGTWIGGRHTTGTGFEADCEKLNAATLNGYRVLRFTPGMVERGDALPVIRRALETL